ncbi:S-adenosyl-L-methionine-dependent methyltransferase [Radiomyces spectabilis]|uniref:S-adenosyl-L-methionine-dependent methyltransferase n=1 Tax=Radiomyces spectabilis TaxID=64574 RepID=UPI00221F7BF0|nr:S-adenosyl-L-methionine-dependent methyltransferase [Radiomyces spectabilis]KAI8379664.1 S-adenosyl-L-methionine-dependent methyltransferase [Radiomyces spectabilis]
MGFRKGGRHNKKKNQAAQPKIDRDTRGPSDKAYTDIPKKNENFENYYKSQNLLSEEEFDTFYSVLQTPLPSTFRITGTRSNALPIRELIEKVYVPSMQNVVVDDVKYEPPRPLEWYPDQLGWQVNAPRAILKRSAEFSKFHKFIVAENESGNLSRQEAVSMVPPLLMDVKPHQWVLDMCAAPGSKTAQIIEAVHANDRLNEMPLGLVVANDADYKRSHMLVHQSKRLQSPCFMATNHDAAHFPNIHVPTGEKGKVNTWQFDRVLCDVPCSGDGTLRKNEKIWKEWTQHSALSLHTTQVQIFLRGAQLLKLGGRIVYSTCSFNPIENEAVVAEVLRLTNGALELKDVSDQLPKLKRKPGIKTWKVMTREGQYINSVDEIEDGRQRFKFPKTVFPPTNPDEFPLERCLRIYPHQQDTGGFFVAVFEKVKPMTNLDRIRQAKNEQMESSEAEAAEAQDEQLVDSLNQAAEEPDQPAEASVPAKRASDVDQEAEKKLKTDDGTSAPQKVKKDVPGIKEAPFELMKTDNPDIDEIREFYGLDPEFPRDQFLLRSEDNAKNRSIYFISKAVKAVLEAHDFERLHTVNTGVRLFVRQGSQMEGGSPFRLTSEGLPMLENVISDRRCVDITVDELKTLLTEAFPKLEEFSEATRTKLQSMDLGCCIFHVDMSKAETQIPDFHMPLSMPVWRGKASLNVLLNKQDKRSLCQRLFGVTPANTPAHLIEKALNNQLRLEAEAAQKSEGSDSDAAAAASTPADQE